MHDFDTGIVGLEVSPDNLFIIGESAVINCTTEIVVDKLLWIDQERDITLASSSSSTMITLKFNPVNDSIHGKSFTCRAMQEMAMVEQHNVIKVNVSGETINYLCSL